MKLSVTPDEATDLARRLLSRHNAEHPTPYNLTEASVTVEAGVLKADLTRPGETSHTMVSIAVNAQDLGEVLGTTEISISVEAPKTAKADV